MGADPNVWKLIHAIGLFTRMPFSMVQQVIRQQYASDGRLLFRIDTSPLFYVGKHSWYLVGDDLVAFVVASQAPILDVLATSEPEALVEVSIC